MENGFDNAVGAPVETVVEAWSGVQRAVVRDDPSGSCAAGDDQVAQACGVSAVVGTSEVDAHPSTSSAYEPDSLANTPA
jgi:hypothetical protein